MTVQQPLTGIRIVDLSRILAGPWCTQLLADLGAEVIKVEHPDQPDPTRQWGPPFDDQGRSSYFNACNRGKQIEWLDYAQDEDRRRLMELIRDCDVLVENFRPGTLAAYGLDAGTLHEQFPALIICSITGYGQTGPHRDRPGFDAMIQAESGLMSITGPESGPASKTGVAVSDLQTGLYAANAIQAALIGRSRHGQGCHLDLALFDVQLACLANVATSSLQTGENPQRYGNAHPSIVPYQVFDCLDQPILLAIGTDRQFSAFCKRARVDWHEDERFGENSQRVRHRQALLALMDPLLRQQPADVWLRRCADADIPAAPINTVRQALESEQSTARSLIQHVDGLSLPACPIRIDGQQASSALAPPLHKR